MYTVTTFIRAFHKDSDSAFTSFIQSAPMSRIAAKRFRNKQRMNGKVAVISRWAFLSF